MKIGKLLISWDRGGMSDEDFDTIDALFEEGKKKGKKLILCTLSARSGTRWLGDVFNAHKNATGITERNFEPECFYRYICYNKLPIDTAGIIRIIKKGIVEDWKKADVSLVISPFFSHGILELYNILSPEKIIFAINEPRFTVQSIYNKGFFEHKYVRGRNDLALGFQPTFPQKWYWLYLFGRLVPNGDFYSIWSGLTRIGKIAWWGSMVNKEIWKQMEELPEDKRFVFILRHADQNYEYYKKIANEFGLSPLLSEKEFLAVKGKTVKAKQNAEHIWSEKEEQEFKEYSKEWDSLYKQLSEKRYA